MNFFGKFVITIIGLFMSTRAVGLTTTSSTGVLQTRADNKIHQSDSFRKIKTLKEIEVIVGQLNPDLVICDIDKTFFTYVGSLHSVGLNNLMDYLMDRLIETEKIKKEDKAKKREELMSIVMKQALYRRTEPDAADILARLSKKYNVMALTNCRTGKYGCIENVEEWKTSLLEEFEIRFSNSFTQQFDRDRDSFFPKESEKEYSCFTRGILYTGRGVSKEDILKKFLERTYLNETISSIVLIDDQEILLNKILKAFENEKINIIAIHYNNPENRTVINPKQEKAPQITKFLANNEYVEYQIKTLLEEKRWISDKDAKKALGTTAQQLSADQRV
jgi:hypothetical protein